MSNDLRKRVNEHNAGKATYTKNRGPWSLIFYEAYSVESDAIRREKYLKTTQGNQAIRRMLRDTLYINMSHYQGSTT